VRRSSRIAVPLLRPEDVIPHLGKPIHWKQGRSAKSLADSWFFSDGFPAAIADLLSQSESLAGAELLEAWLERETDLQDGRATPSQTDLLALLAIGDRLAVLGIEAKVDESFGPLVSEWLASGSEGKGVRLTRLCELYDVDPAHAGHLRYQLFHRTAAAILEARRFRCDVAILIVQSFCPQSTGLRDATAFFEFIGMPRLDAGKLIGPRRFGDVEFWVGWASDTICVEE
jgi:hypothetical protein